MDTKFEVDEFYDTDDAPRSDCKCPVCGSYNISCGSIDYEVNGIYQQVSCDECGARWTDCYRYTGFIFEGMEED